MQKRAPPPTRSSRSPPRAPHPPATRGSARNRIEVSGLFQLVHRHQFTEQPQARRRIGSRGGGAATSPLAGRPAGRPAVEVEQPASVFRDGRRRYRRRGERTPPRPAPAMRQCARRWAQRLLAWIPSCRRTRPGREYAATQRRPRPGDEQASASRRRQPPGRAAGGGQIVVSEARRPPGRASPRA
jgi:hypothetical protein